MSYQIAFTAMSTNVKTGRMPVTTTEPDTCPAVCPFNSHHANATSEGGCYAEAGPLALFWRKVGERKAGISWSEAMSKIAALPKGTLWRHNQAGDLPGIDGAIDLEALASLVKANKGKRGFTFTHKPVAIASEREAISQANASGFTINLSGNTLEHADELADLAIGPVVSVLPLDMARKADRSGQWLETLAEYRVRVGKPKTPKGKPVTVCPATYQDDMSCARCGLCSVANRRAVVGFPAHGNGKRKADIIANG
jgi:hypothetical protein